jgi:hypothetical protein
MEPVPTETARLGLHNAISAREARLAGVALTTIVLLLVLGGLQMFGILESLADWSVVLRNVSGWVGPVAVAGAAGAAAAAAAAAGAGGGVAAASGAAGAAAAAGAPDGTTDDRLRRDADDHLHGDRVPGSWDDDYHSGGPHWFLGWLTQTGRNQGRGGDTGAQAGLGGGEETASDGEMSARVVPGADGRNRGAEPNS